MHPAEQHGGMIRGFGLFGVLAIMPTGCYGGAAGVDPAGLYAAMIRFV